MVNTIDSIEFVPISNKDNAGDGAIKILLDDTYTPCLLNTYHCTRAVIWWDISASEYDENIIVYAVEDISVNGIDTGPANINKVESWYEFDLLDAFKWTIKQFV